MQDILHRGEEIKAVIIGMDEDYSNISLSTSVLESREGEIMEDKEAVWANAGTDLLSRVIECLICTFRHVFNLF
jgi:predicted RNA-binding protein with RPS1 domain